MGVVVPGDVDDAGVGHHADHASFFLLSPDDPINARKSVRDVAHDIVHPAVVLILQLLGRKIPAFAAHFRKAQAVAVLGKLRKAHGLAWAVLVEDIAEEGITDGSFALHHGVVVIEHQAGVFQHGCFLHRYLSAAIIAKFPRRRNRKLPLVLCEQMYYNIEKQSGKWICCHCELVRTEI